jgi:predicted O-linked N-acetylglucosamine transferase (SPINDLY family)
MAQENQIKKQLIEAFEIHNKNNLAEAKIKYEKILEIDPGNFDANNLLGTLLIEIKDFKNAEKYLTKSLSINSSIPGTYNNLGIALKEQGKINESLEKFSKAIIIKNDYVDAYNNRGLIFISQKNYDLAINDFNSAIKIKPDSILAYNSIAICLFNLQNFDAALFNCNISLAIKKNLDALLISADIYFLKKKYSDAINNFNEAFKINKNINDRLLTYIISKKQIADWEGLDDLCLDFETNIKKFIYSGNPFLSLNILECPDLQQKYAEIYIKNKFNNYPRSNHNNFNYPKHKKIRVGYFSSDFRSHPVGHLIVGLIENHNKDLFEIYGFSLISLKKEIKDDNFTKRILNSLIFIDISLKSAEDVFNLCKSLEIDIAVDLNGFTQYSKPEIFYKRVAPIQINYLGYPGTLGSNMADYLICDEKIIPEKYHKYYSEKIISLPNCYQPYDDKQEISANVYNKLNLNLPNYGFIFCNFNNIVKINSMIFSIWMKILYSVENSVLWLAVEDKITQNNLINEAKRFNISKNRIIFANRLPIEAHLARIKNADLFLDSYPYNAHTTARDFLSANVPILTLKGKTFASRVAFSLLTNLGVEKELVAKNIEEYQNKAIEIANNRLLHQAIKNKIIKNKLISKIFKTKIYTSDIEKAYLKIYNRYINKQTTENIKIN